MKFSQLLDTNMVPEWRKQYLDYQELDAALNKAVESKNMKAREKGVDMYFQLIKFNQKFANLFSRECQAQLDKINAFHREKLSEMKGKYKNLQDQLDQVLSSAIYRELQPDLSANASHHNIQSSSSYNTVTSISELFKNFKDKFGHTRTDALGSSANLTDQAQRYQQEHQKPRLSLFPGQVNITPTGIAENIRRGSGFRAGREIMSDMARKLSEGFSHSTHRLTSNLGFVSSQQGPQSISTNGKSRVSVLINEHNNTSQSSANISNGLLDINMENFQSIAGATPQSKRKIVASYKKKISNLKFAFRELYFNLVLFEQYTQLNHNGFEQILRKHDRMFASTLGRKFYQEHVQTADFYNDLQAIDHLIESVEHVYTLHFENGNRRKAIEKLQVPTNIYKPSSPHLDFRVGYELGMFAVLLVLVILVGFISDTGYDWRTVFRLYRSPFILIIFLFQTGISIVIWKHYKINHVLIFELNPRNNLSFQHFIEFGSLLGIIWSISVLLFLFSSHLHIKPSLCPLGVVVIIVCYLFNPTATCHHRARFWLLRILVSTI